MVFLIDERDMVLILFAQINKINLISAADLATGIARKWMNFCFSINLGIIFPILVLLLGFVKARLLLQYERITEPPEKGLPLLNPRFLRLQNEGIREPPEEKETGNCVQLILTCVRFVCKLPVDKYPLFM